MAHIASRVVRAFSQNLPTVRALNHWETAAKSSTLFKTTTQSRWSSFKSSQPVADIEQYPQVKVEQNPPEWKYVQRLLGNTLVPHPEAKPLYPSGWQPPNREKSAELPYFVERTKNHMVPIYLERRFRGLQRTTRLRRVQGDIFTLERILKQIIEKSVGRTVASRVNEMSGQISFRGDFVAIVEKFLLSKGF